MTAAYLGGRSPGAIMPRDTFRNNLPRLAFMAAPSISERITRWLIAWRWPLAALTAAIMVWIVYEGAYTLSFDRSIENMFAADDPLLVPYRQLKRTFGGNEIALAAYIDPDLLTEKGMERLDELSRAMQDVPGVQAVLSLTTTPLGREIIYDDVLGPRFISLLEGFTIGADRQTAAVVCMLAPEDETPTPRPATVAELRRLVQEHDPSGVLTGEPVMVVDGFQYLEEDGELLGRTANALLILTIILCFRSLRWVAVPVAVVSVNLWITKAVLVAGGFRLSMVSSMLWAIVTVVGIAMVVHIIVQFREERERGVSPEQALVRCGTLLIVPIMWVCFTDAAGFVSLLAAKVGPVNDFGKMMAMGSLLALFSAATVIPALALVGRIKADPRRAWGEQILGNVLEWIVRFVERWPRTLGVLTVSVVLFAWVGYIWLDVETDFTRNFRQSSPIVRSYAVVESRLGGGGVWDVLLPVPNEIDHALLDRVRRLEERLRTEIIVADAEGNPTPGLTKVLSLTDALDTVATPQMQQLTTPDDLVSLFRSQMPAVVDALVGTDPQTKQRTLRIMLRARERQPAEQKDLLISRVTEICREEFPEAQVTGFFVLLTNLIDSMLRDQWVSFSIAMTAIAVMMYMAFKSAKLAIIAMIPNALPITVITGLMGWLDVRLNMGAAMIAAVSIGQAVDSSIHYITEYLEHRREGMRVQEALVAVQQRAGRAMVFSTLAMIVGFSALCLSQFVPLIYFGVLMCLAMAGGLIGNLVLLPLLLRWAARGEKPPAPPQEQLLPAAAAR